MAHAGPSDSLSRHISEMSRIARDLRGVPGDIVVEAARATAIAFSGCQDKPGRLRYRSESYFWKVIRRRLVGRRTPSSATARMVVDAVVADLVQAGRDPESVWSELERGWRDKIPIEVLEEYRVRLCA